MATYTYTANCGQYVLNEDGRPIAAPLDEVSLAMDSQEGALYKHGSVASVQAWVNKAKRKGPDGTCTDLANHIVVLTGRFKIEDLNLCLTSGGYALELYKRAVSGDLAQYSFAEAVQEGSDRAAQAPRLERPGQ